MNSSSPQVALSLDTDWAADCAIDFTADLLLKAGVKATWFVTHDSSAIRRLQDNPLFEVGIHPNFFPGSTQGATPEAVLKTCMGFVPKARCMRIHGLYQYSDLLALVMQLTPIRVDSSLYLPKLAGLTPIIDRMQGRELVRIPYSWADDAEMGARQPSWELRDKFPTHGLTVFNFHPLHVFLNSRDMMGYNAAKKLGVFSQLTASQLKPLINSRLGAGTLFRELLDYLARQGEAPTLLELAKPYLCD